MSAYNFFHSLHYLHHIYNVTFWWNIGKQSIPKSNDAYRSISSGFYDHSKAVLLSWIICVFVSYVSHAFASIHCCIVFTCWERTDLLALLGDGYCFFCYFPIWYPGSGVVLDFIVFWSMPSFLLLNYLLTEYYIRNWIKMKIPSNNHCNGNGLVQSIRMGKYILYKWVDSKFDLR